MNRETNPDTTKVIKEAPAKTLLSPTSLASTPIKSIKPANRLGVSFPRGRRATLATVGGSFKNLDNFSKEKQKESLAMLPNI